MTKQENIRRVVSFDIGYNHFSYFVEDFDIDKLVDYQDNINKKLKKFNVDGTPTEETEEILNFLYSIGKTVDYGDFCINTENKKFGKTISDEDIIGLCITMNEFLLDNKQIWDECDIILIEKQMNFGKFKTNPWATKLSHNCFFFFVREYQDTKILIEFPAAKKTKNLGIEKIKKQTKTKTSYVSQTKPNRKKWTVVKGREILNSRDEADIVEIIKNDYSKQDDIYDNLCQINGYKFDLLFDNI